MRNAAFVFCLLTFVVIPWICHGQAVSLVTLGDSLTAGDGDDGVGGGYPARLINMLQDQDPASTLSNLAVSGFTSDDLINVELDPAVSFLNAAPGGNRRVALVWIGSNDLFGLYNYVCDEEYDNDYQACEDATFGYYSDNLDTILSALTGTGAEVFIALLDDQSLRPVMTDPALRASSFDQISAEDVARMSVQVTRYNTEIASQAAAHGASTVDFFNTTIFTDWNTLDSDGNHPNGAGYDAIAAIWHAAITGSGGGGSYSYVVPVVVHAPGDAGTNWRSSVVCVNSSGAAAHLDLELVGADGSWSVSRTVAAGASVEWPDLVVELFGRPAGAATSGALHISSDQPVWITSRTFNQGSTGTFGQYLPALQADEVLSGGDRGYLLNLKGVGFRSNVGLVNLGNSSCEIELKLYAASGAAIGTTPQVTVAAGRWVQKNDVFDFVDVSPRPLAYATVRRASGSCTFWAYASVVDEDTGDATTIPVLWQ